MLFLLVRCMKVLPLYSTLASLARGQSHQFLHLLLEVVNRKAVGTDNPGLKYGCRLLTVQCTEWIVFSSGDAGYCSSYFWISTDSTVTIKVSTQKGSQCTATELLRCLFSDIVHMRHTTMSFVDVFMCACKCENSHPHNSCNLCDLAMPPFLWCDLQVTPPPRTHTHTHTATVLPMWSNSPSSRISQEVFTGCTARNQSILADTVIQSMKSTAVVLKF